MKVCVTAGASGLDAPMAHRFVEKFKRGELTKIAGPSVQAHAGMGQRRGPGGQCAGRGGQGQ